MSTLWNNGALKTSIILALLLLLVEGKFYSTDLAGQRLIKDLLISYDANARPAPKGVRIDVNVSIHLLHFDFQESDGSMKLNTIMYVKWRDPKLGWNPKDYNNLTRIPIKYPAKVWAPDLEFYNNDPYKFVNMRGYYGTVLEHTGVVLWNRPVTVTVFCTMNMRNWPHDSHACKLSLGSWTYDGFELYLNNVEPNATMKFDELEEKNMEYRITNFSAEHVATVYDCCTEPYITIDYHIKFERRSSFVIIFRASALCIILLTLLALTLEPWRGEKIWINGISFLITVFNLLYFAKQVSNFARHTPLIVVFYSSSLMLVTLGQLIAVFSLMASCSSRKSKLPWRVSRFLQNSWVAYLAPPIKTLQVSHDPDPVDINSEYEDVRLQEYNNLICGGYGPNKNEWIQLAMTLERFAILVFAAIFLLLGTICFV